MIIQVSRDKEFGDVLINWSHVFMVEGRIDHGQVEIRSASQERVVLDFDKPEQAEEFMNYLTEELLVREENRCTSVWVNCRRVYFDERVLDVNYH